MTTKRELITALTAAGIEYRDNSEEYDGGEIRSTSIVKVIEAERGQEFGYNDFMGADITERSINIISIRNEFNIDDYTAAPVSETVAKVNDALDTFYRAA